ncbi:nitrous oxide-stimulated promoter family protein [Vibrio sp. SS-MA-C1-2]|uniref:nitrous oxide-stimulated promoter family protein n=1 Tax=Vibrio sp. SS-MA-C1-2 TaxID=2908646 RepID=UPI001F16165A|nr:nitrous oxide-stimulated promoter family protein [Vibrio sp. SS-MA-C1-2]UJF16887.1 nitrous oxide-stimulated promoter family protein [Vibrio sp. SS-MA-C1-2]
MAVELLGKLQSEFKMVKAMMTLYCHAHHQTDTDLCAKCEDLANYAEMRLDRCPFGEDKPTCNKCPIHCYKPEQKEQMRQVMIYAGPRIMLKHPILAISHLIREKKPAPSKPETNNSNRLKRKGKS